MARILIEASQANGAVETAEKVFVDDARFLNVMRVAFESDPALAPAKRLGVVRVPERAAVLQRVEAAQSAARETVEIVAESLEVPVGWKLEGDGDGENGDAGQVMCEVCEEAPGREMARRLCCRETEIRGRGVARRLTCCTA